MIQQSERLLSVGELALALGRHQNYVYAMKGKGFLMPGNRATLSEARNWLVRNPAPHSRKSGKELKGVEV